MTGAHRAHPLQSRAPSPGLALVVGLDPSAGPAERAALVDIARAIESVVAELAPGASTRSALTLGGRGPHGAVVARVREQLATVEPSPFLAQSEEERRAPARREVIVDPTAHEVIVDGRPVAVTFKEFALLEYLLRSPYRAVTREELLESVWHKRAWRNGTRTIDVHVRRLREKLGGCPQIVTVRGVGYRCDPTPEVVLVGSGDAD